MSNYTPTGNPISASRGVSGLMRAEFALIQTAIASKGDYATPNVWGGLQDFSGATMTLPSGGVTLPNGSRATTQPVGDNSTLVATMAALIAQAFATALPNQAGNSGKFVSTNGVTASWQSVFNPSNYAMYGAL